MGTADCPFKTAPWNTKRADEHDEHDELAKDPWRNDVKGRGCAFVVTVFGSNVQYCVDAAVLGQSIRATGTKHSMILLKNNRCG